MSAIQFRKSRGSSPRMRGMHARHSGDWAVSRIIPAYAGNAPHWPVLAPRTPDHPRVCGECTESRYVLMGDHGSSPRMRGMRSNDTHRARRGRIIPAYAGNACRRGSRRRPRPDHPRVCGECHLSTTQDSARVGSSPRMRGMPARRGLCAHRCRIIPAYAGNALTWAEVAACPTDHPRVCGECNHDWASHGADAGSSPRMRGMHLVPVAVVPANRIIPAYAGNAGCRWR